MHQTAKLSPVVITAHPADTTVPQNNGLIVSDTIQFGGSASGAGDLRTFDSSHSAPVAHHHGSTYLYAQAGSILSVPVHSVAGSYLSSFNQVAGTMTHPDGHWAGDVLSQQPHAFDLTQALVFMDTIKDVPPMDSSTGHHLSVHDVLSHLTVQSPLFEQALAGQLDSQALEHLVTQLEHGLSDLKPLLSQAYGDLSSDVSLAQHVLLTQPTSSAMYELFDAGQSLSTVLDHSHAASSAGMGGDGLLGSIHSLDALFTSPETVPLTIELHPLHTSHVSDSSLLSQSDRYSGISTSASSDVGGSVLDASGSKDI